MKEEKDTELESGSSEFDTLGDSLEDPVTHWTGTPTEKEKDRKDKEKKEY